MCWKNLCKQTQWLELRFVTESHGAVSLVAFVLIFFVLGVWTYGLSVSSGVFIPSLAIGAAWGRLVGMGVAHLMPENPNLVSGRLLSQHFIGKYFALLF